MKKLFLLTISTIIINYTVIAIDDIDLINQKFIEMCNKDRSANGRHKKSICKSICDYKKNRLRRLSSIIHEAYLETRESYEELIRITIRNKKTQLYYDPLDEIDCQNRFMLHLKILNIYYKICNQEFSDEEILNHPKMKFLKEKITDDNPFISNDPNHGYTLMGELRNFKNYKDTHNFIDQLRLKNL